MSATAWSLRLPIILWDAGIVAAGACIAMVWISWREYREYRADTNRSRNLP